MILKGNFTGYNMKKKIKHSRRSRTGQVAGDYDGEINNKNLHKQRCTPKG